MTLGDFDYEWADRLNDGVGGWRITEHENKPFRDADDFLAALKDKLS